MYDGQFYADLYTPEDKIEYLFRLCAFKPGDRILDVGCGRGELLFKLADLGSYECVGIEASQAAVDLAAQQASQMPAGPGKICFLKMDCTALKFPDASFDYVFMADIVEHLNDENLSKSISEAARILKPGGSLLIHTEPTVNYKRYGQYFSAYFFKTKGIQWLTPTIREEGLRGHVNIQSGASLKNYLVKFFEPAKTRVFYAPIHKKGMLKKTIGALGLWSIFSPHLWAVAVK